MYINEDLGFLFISMPRCATQMLHPLLHEHYRGEQITKGGCHTNWVPEGANDLFTWTVSRHPYQRAVSMYWYLLKHPFRKLVLTTFDAFCDCILLRVADGRHGPCFPMWQQIQGIRIDRVVRFGHLHEDLKTLPFWTGPKVLLSGAAASKPDRPAEELLTPRNVEKLKRWAGPDFEMFGYSTEV